MFKNVSLIISLLLSGTMLLSGCSIEEQRPNLEVSNPEVVNPIIEQVSGEEAEIGNLNEKTIGFNVFDSSLISFIDIEKSKENYMISPLSFKCALGLAVSGASGDTAKELYSVLGYDDFSDFESLMRRINDLKVQFDSYNERIQGYEWIEEKEKEGMKIHFDVANSVWDVSGKLKEDYIEEVKSKMNAEAKNTTINTVVEEVNTWVNEKTRGLIPRLLTMAPNDLGAVLVNTVYLKSSWFEEFSVSSNPMKFTDISNNIIEKESINKTDKFAYYKDDDSELVIVPLNGGANIAYVLGSRENISEKINKAEKKKEIYVEVPKIEMETTFDKKELVNYLQANGVKEAFLETADFDKMSEDMSIGDIIQKTKIKTDEKGLEAAAATAIIMKDNAMFIEQEEPIKFICDKPFSFYIYSEIDGVKDLMFFGNYVK